MQSSSRVDDSPAASEHLELARHLPGTLIAAAAGTANDTVRRPGLILTQEQLVDLKRYETHGLALPTALKDVIGYLGYETGAGPNLEARDFQTTFNRIHDHASQWNPLRTDLMNAGSELWVFADQIEVYGAGVQQLYDALKTKLPGSTDTADQADFLHYLQQVAALVLDRIDTTEALKHRLDGFSRELSATLMPDVQLKLRSIDADQVSAEIRALNDTINRRATEIEEKQREYATLVKKSVGAIFTSVGLGLYRSAEADKVRKQINTLRQEQHKSIQLLEQKNRIHASLQRVRNDLHDLKLVILDADMATQNLTLVWNGLHVYLMHSVEEAGKVDTTLSLRRLMNAFKLVADPWGQIKRDADTLLKVFKDADRQFRNDYGLN